MKDERRGSYVITVNQTFTAPDCVFHDSNFLPLGPRGRAQRAIIVKLVQYKENGTFLHIHRSVSLQTTNKFHLTNTS